MSEGQFRAGVGRASITPGLGVPHASWGAQVHVFPDGVEADLWATVLLVTDGATMAAFVDLDLVIISREESDAIRSAVGQALGTAASQIRCSVTHNHAGPPPSAWDWTEGADALRDYYRALPAAASEAARLALNDLRPARVAVDAGSSYVAVNRRETAPDGRTVTGTNPDGAIDPQVFVVRIDGAAGDPLAAIVGYTMHPTTMGPTNRLISPDWPGHLKRTLEALTGAICLFVQGATGDIGPGPDGFTDDVRVIKRMGAAVGAEATRVYLGMRLPPVRYEHERVWESGAPLGKWRAVTVPEPEPVVRTMERQVHLPVRPMPTLAEAEADVRDAVGHLNALKQQGASATAIEAATFVTKRANMTLFRVQTFGERATFPIRLHLLQIGPVVLVGAECEPFSAIGIAIKEQSPFPQTWFGGYTGGWFGYIPMPDAYPQGGYEVHTSPYAPEAAATLVAETVAALHDLAGS
jgi:hypothetical protein